jgi:hypothetical protein
VAGAGWEHGLETAVHCNRQKALKQLQVAMQHQICGEDHAPFDSWPVNEPSICSHVRFRTNSELDCYCVYKPWLQQPFCARIANEPSCGQPRVTCVAREANAFFVHEMPLVLCVTVKKWEF